jgi:hypothetical protein
MARVLRANENHERLAHAFAEADELWLEVGEILPERRMAFLVTLIGKTARFCDFDLIGSLLTGRSQGGFENHDRHRDRLRKQKDTSLPPVPALFSCGTRNLERALLHQRWHSTARGLPDVQYGHFKSLRSVLRRLRSRVSEPSEHPTRTHLTNESTSDP